MNLNCGLVSWTSEYQFDFIHSASVVLGGVIVIVFAIGLKVHGFKPG
jgi:hypothetical protein